jgi:tetratricopeptide (TPR) repeat protein
VTGKGPRRGFIAGILLALVVAWTGVRVSASEFQAAGRQAVWTERFHAALSRYEQLARWDPLDLAATDGRLEVLLAAMESPGIAAAELGIDFPEAARRGGEVLRRLVGAAPLRPETWNGVADFFGTVKIENQRHRVYALEEITPRAEENLEPEDLLQIRALERSARVDPNGVYYWDTLGDLCWNIGLKGLAKEAYGEAVTLLPDPSQHLFLAPVGRPPELAEIGIRAMERALTPPRNANPEKVYRHLGGFLLGSGRFAEARRAFEKAEACSSDGSYIFFQAYAATRQGQDEEAIRLYRKSLAQDHLEANGRFRNHLNLGQLLEKVGRHEEAARELQVALDLRPRDPRALLILGQIDETLGLVNEAEELYLKAAETSEEPITPLVNLVAFYRRVGRPAEALVPARKLAELQPEEEIYKQLVQQLRAEIDSRRAR